MLAGILMGSTHLLIQVVLDVAPEIDNRLFRLRQLLGPL